MKHPQIIGDLAILRDRLTALFEDSLSLTSEAQAAGDWTASWAPVVDVIDSGASFILQAELPGICMEEIKLEEEDTSVSISGERKLNSDKGPADYHRIERIYGAFHRRITLPAPVDKDKVAAKYHDGVLTVDLPRKTQASRSIPIESS